MRIVIDAESCQGHGRCWDSAPELVDCDEAGRGVVRGDGVVPAELEAKAKAAFRACPERAVTLPALAEAKKATRSPAAECVPLIMRSRARTLAPGG